MTDNLHREQWTELSEIDREVMSGNGGGPIKGLRAKPAAAPVNLVTTAKTPSNFNGPLSLFIVFGVIQTTGAIFCTAVFNGWLGDDLGIVLLAVIAGLVMYPSIVALSLCSLIGIAIYFSVKRPAGWVKLIYLGLFVLAAAIATHAVFFFVQTINDM